MIADLNYKGKWWIPHMPDKQILGVLAFNPKEGTELNLEGVFVKDNQGVHEIANPEIILGISTDNKDITLLNRFASNLTFNTNGGPTSSYNVDLIFVGMHFNKLEDIKFKKISVYYSYLDDWINIPKFDFQNFEKSGSIKAIMSNNFTIYLVKKSEFSSFSHGAKKLSVKEKPYIEIEAFEERPLEDFRKVMRLMENFLSLGILKPVYPLEIKGTKETIKMPIDIYYQLLEVPLINRVLPSIDMLFTFRDISDRFEKLLENWFRKAEVLEPVYIQYSGIVYNSRRYLEDYFLSLVQAIEFYHRRAMNNYELTEEKHNLRLAEIITSVPDKHKEWLIGKLTHSNEPNLPRRLVEVFDKCSDVINNFIKDRGAFINKVVKTRNYLIHQNPKLKDEAAKGDELDDLTQKLKILIEICLMNELGFTLAEVKNLFLKNAQYEYYHRIWNK